jgi:hypothetical protein
MELWNIFLDTNNFSPSLVFIDFLEKSGIRYNIYTEIIYYFM